MNDENERSEPRADDTAEMREALITELQEEIEQLQEEIDNNDDAIIAAAQAIPETAAPAGDAELRALAVTVRTAQRSGHPDAAKHLDALLTALGAV